MIQGGRYHVYCFYADGRVYYWRDLTYTLAINQKATSQRKLLDEGMRGDALMFDDNLELVE